MLQQTRASVVIPYFLRWMELFPNVKALYIAPLEQVIKAWEGLGYYSRARGIHKAARQIVEEFGGEIPDTKEELQKIYGFGPYTTNAVLSFGFKKRAAPVDGNVLRVVSRYFCVEENISKGVVRRKIEERAEELLDGEAPWVTAEALIELGATVCLPKPRCEECPLRGECLARQRGCVEMLPIKNEEKKITELRRIVWVIEKNGAVLVKKGASGKVMADLYEFPYAEEGEEAKFVKGELTFVRKLRPQSHSFTRFRAHLSPMFVTTQGEALGGWEWVPIANLKDLPFSSGHRKIVEEVCGCVSCI